jgi:hypothetical protein
MFIVYTNSRRKKGSAISSATQNKLSSSDISIAIIATDAAAVTAATLYAFDAGITLTQRIDQQRVVAILFEVDVVVTLI